MLTNKALTWYLLWTDLVYTYFCTIDLMQRYIYSTTIHSFFVCWENYSCFKIFGVIHKHSSFLLVVTCVCLHLGLWKQGPDGYIVDCVHVHTNQLLITLTSKITRFRLVMQIRLNFHPKGFTFGDSKISSNWKPLTQVWHKIGMCSEETILYQKYK